MLSLDINHPDAGLFIGSKMEQGKITGANISVRVDNAFMESLNYTGGILFDRNKELWNKIIHNAWKSAEPGVLFWDTIITESVADSYASFGFRTISTNPCGEIPLCPYDSCRLIAINLYSYVENPFTPEARFNVDLFKKHSGYMTRIMDDIIDLELEKIDQIIWKIEADPEPNNIKRMEFELWLNIREMAIKGRRAGIGITAEGDMLAALGLRYGSEDAIDFSENIHKILAKNVYLESVYLGDERGNFPVFNWELEKNNPFIQRLIDGDSDLELLMSEGRRHIALLTIAPTGTVSLMTQTTSGIENIFLPWYKRRRKLEKWDTDKVDFVDEMGDHWEEYFVLHKPFIDWYAIHCEWDFDFAKEVLSGMNENDLQIIFKESPYYKATSNDVDWVAKVKMQGKIQKWVDHSIE